MHAEQGTFITGVLSTAFTAHCGVLILYLHALYLLSTVPLGISLPPYCTYVHIFNFRSIVVREI